MFRIYGTLSLIVLLVSGLAAQQPAPTPQAPKTNEPGQVYWGGELGVSFGSYFRVSLVPLVGYKVTPKFHVGGKLGFSYVEDKRYETKVTSFNYGGSVFTRYLLVKGLYAHAEFAYWSYKYRTENLEGDRTWVPFLLVGGGYVQPVSPSTSLFVELLWDVLNDKNSPYDSTEPWIKVGVGVGF
jgi:hypothetical protein